MQAISAKSAMIQMWDRVASPRADPAEKNKSRYIRLLFVFIITNIINTVSYKIIPVRSMHCFLCSALRKVQHLLGALIGNPDRCTPKACFTPGIPRQKRNWRRMEEQHEPVGPARTRPAFRIANAWTIGGVTVSTGSIAAWEACRGVGTRNRLQKQSCQR